MSGQTIKVAALFALVGGTWLGCAAKRAATVPAPTKPSEKVTTHDLNRDSKADVWVYSLPATTGGGANRERVLRKELDINWDGKVDITRIYGEREVILEERLDLDFDGKLDQVNFYEQGLLVRKERDLDTNGRIDQWMFYERGKLARTERDENGDGKVDLWEHWEGDAPTRIGEDTNGDGQPDRWTEQKSTD